MQIEHLVGLLAPYAVSVVVGIFTWRNTIRIAKESSSLEELKSRLGHKQLVDSTQWAAEFSAYQALWKSLVPLRSLAHKLVMRESELSHIGLEEGDVAEAKRVDIRMGLLRKYAQVLSDCMLAINDQAPFYAADIRKAANRIHDSAYAVHRTQIAAVVSLEKRRSFTGTLDAFSAIKSREDLEALMLGVDEIEGMIRKRLSDVGVIA